MHYRQRSRWWKATGIAVLLVGLAALAVVWPARLGGSVTYVTTRGSSMEPAVHQGDLALVRPAGQYRVGDVVAYHSQLLNTIVMHRVVARHGDRYVFQGDNNSWLDRDRPTHKDLVGSVWVQIPKGGLVLEWIRRPTTLLGGLALLLLASGAALGTRRHRRPGAPTRRRRNTPRQPTRAWLTAAIVCLVAAAACAALGTVAFTRPSTAPATQTGRYTQHGEFTYNAAAPPGPVYDNNTVATGDPVFLRLVQTVNVAFSYQFDATAPTAMTGTMGLRAQITSGTGWRHRLELQPATPFTGDHAELHVAINAAQLQALITQVEILTGIQDGTYTVTLLPEVQIIGTVAGQKLHDTFDPHLNFTLDRHQLRLTDPATDPATATATATATAKTTNTVLTPAVTGTFRQPIPDAPTELHLFGRSLAVTDIRRVAPTLGAVFALAAVAALIGLRRRWHGQASRIELRHGHRLIPVAAQQPHAQPGTVDLTNMHDLVRLADQHASLIFHRQTETTDDYQFQADHITYRYVQPNPPAQSPSTAPTAATTRRRHRRRGEPLQGIVIHTTQ